MATLLDLLVPIFPPKASAAGASLFISPSQGQYQVDGTFQISIMVNTGGQAVNTINAQLTFPADKLQVVNPTVSESFIQVWTSGPSFSNTNGTLNFQGGLPSPGINTSAGVISTIQFRARAAGRATIKFTDDSKVLANDGAGTNILTSKSSSTLTIGLAPPAGPQVTSPTHEDQNKWYKSRAAILQWEVSAGEKEFSYVLDTVAGTTPEPTTNSTVFELAKTVDADGVWYFHIRAKNANTWGGTTHYSIKIDGTGPAGFTPKLGRTTIASGNHELVTFTTTDAVSGVDHYETRIVSKGNPNDATSFFTEAQSPYQLPELPEGDYTLIVRAVDAAGNTTDGTVDFSIVSGAAALTVGRPLIGNPLISNIVLALLGLILLVLLIIWLRRRRHGRNLAQLRNDLIELKQTVSARQGEIKGLADLAQSSEAAIVGTSAPVTATPPQPLPPTAVAPPELVVPSNDLPQSADPGQFPPTQQL